MIAWLVAHLGMAGATVALVIAAIVALCALGLIVIGLILRSADELDRRR